jgi:hypothetical protein
MISSAMLNLGKQPLAKAARAQEATALQMRAMRNLHRQDITANKRISTAVSG